MASTKHDDYKHDQGWEGIPDREHEYEQKEYDEYAHHREQDMVSRARHPVPVCGTSPIGVPAVGTRL